MQVIFDGNRNATVLSVPMTSPLIRTFKNFFTSAPSPRSEQRVVIAGIGLVSPLGHSLTEFWSRLTSGETGIDFIRSFDTSSFPCRIAAELPEVRFRDFLSRTQIGYYPRATQLACVAFQLAKQDAGISEFDPTRTDILIGTSSNAFEYIDKEAGRNNVNTFGGFDPIGISKLNFNCTAAAIAAHENLAGYAATISTACASGINALGLGMERIRFGLADTVIVGAADVGVTRFLLNLFCSAKFVSFSENPNQAVKPFDVEHTRSVLGDGACVFILKRESEARAANLKMYGRLAGFSQAYENVDGLFHVDESGTRWGKTITKALESAPGEIDYVNAHGPGDLQLDDVELRALDLAFLGRKAPFVSSIKSSIGSPFAAAGAFQVVSTLLSLKTGMIPPNRGLANPTKSNNLTLVGGKAVRTNLKRALINSRGLGGVNTSLICESTES